MRNCFCILILLFSFNLSAQKEKEINYSGILTLNNGTPLTFEMELIEKGGIVNGFSITGKGTPDQTKSDISGTYNRNQKSYSLKESQVLETNSEADLNVFCYIHMEIKEVGKFSLKKLEGEFTGYFTNGEKCANGKIVMIEKEKLKKKLEKIQKKVEKKIEKEKKKENIVLETKILKDGDDMSVNWSSDKIIIYIWDSNMEDGDRINLIINGKTILQDFKTKRKRKKIKYKLKKGGNSIEIMATNLGKNPPNTSRIELVDKKTKYPIITQLKPGKSAIIQIMK